MSNNPFPADFVKYITDNPHVMRLFWKFAREAKSAGHKKYSHCLIVNRIRWETDIKTVAFPPFKISNNHIAYLARLLIKIDPTFQDFFTLKGLKYAKKI